MRPLLNVLRRALVLGLATPLAAQQRAPRPLQLHVSTAAVYESNLEHDAEALAALGGVVALGVDLSDRVRRPRLALAYEAALHRYSVATPYQRTSHRAGAVVTLRPAAWLGLETEGVLRLRGGADDRDLNDEYGLSEEVELRLARPTAVRLAGALRLKRAAPSLSPGRNAESWSFGLEVRQRLTAGGRFLIGARLEDNRADSARYRYRRTTWTFALESAPGRWQQVEVGVRYRDQRYPERRLDDRPVLRRDYRVTPSIAWRVRPWMGFEMQLAYEYEHRASNDPGKGYSAHQGGLTLTQRW